MNTRKRILFCIENFHHGGITKALENILALIDHKRYDVGIFVVNQEDGPYKSVFKPYLKYSDDSLLKAICTNYRKHSGLKKYALLTLKMIRKFSDRCGCDLFEKRLSRWAKRISADKYDCVIAFAEGYITKFVSQVTGHKIAWVHIDYKRYLTYQPGDEYEIYSKYNYIVIPSEFSKKSFNEVFPRLANRVVVLPNLLDLDSVRCQSEAKIRYDERFTSADKTIISVGRICYEKRFFLTPPIAKKLKDSGLSFKWYIVGGGSEAETSVLQSAIRENGMESYIVLLGRVDNPYTYIAKSDLLVSTSLSETFSYVVFEAKALGVPVLCADFGTAPEILTSEEGIISSVEDMADSILRMFSDNNRLLDTYKNRLKTYSYDNDAILQKFYKIIDNSDE